MLDAAAFLTAFPAFASAPAGLVASRVAMAAAQIEPTVWLDLTNTAHGLLTAHLLSLDPNGQAARLSAKDAETTYSVELEKLRPGAGCAIRVFE